MKGTAKGLVTIHSRTRTALHETVDVSEVTVITLSRYMPRRIEENHEIRLSAYLVPHSTWNHYRFNTSHIMTAATASGGVRKLAERPRYSLNATVSRHDITRQRPNRKPCDTVELPSTLALFSCSSCAFLCQPRA